MRRNESRVIALVDLDDEEGCEEGEKADGLDGEMDACSDEFLAGCGGRLEDESALDLEEDGRGV